MAVVGFAALIGIVGLCWWLVAEAVRTSVVRVRGGSYSRSEESAWFWTVIALYCGMAAMVIYTLAYLFLPRDWLP